MSFEVELEELHDVWTIDVVRDPDDADVVLGVRCRSGDVRREFMVDEFEYADGYAREAARYVCGDVNVEAVDLAALMLDVTT